MATAFKQRMARIKFRGLTAGALASAKIIGNGKRIELAGNRLCSAAVAQPQRRAQAVQQATLAG